MLKWIISEHEALGSETTGKRCLAETLDSKQNKSDLKVLGPTFKHSKTMKYWLGFVDDAALDIEPIITYELKQAEALQSVKGRLATAMKDEGGKKVS